MKKQYRITWIDMLKGYGMLMVMLSHIAFVPHVYKYFIGPVFLTIFFWSAGYTFRCKNNFGEFFISKIRRLIIPLFALGIIDILATKILTFSEQEPLTLHFMEKQRN